jgi:opacity protein-like surface antigen
MFAMKKVIFACIVALGLSSAAQAQLKPEAGSVGFGFRINGIANTALTNWSNTHLAGQSLVDPLGLLGAPTAVTDLVPQEMFFGRYYIASDLALRVGLGINSLSAKTSSTDTIIATPTTTDTKTSAFSFGINLGVEKHFASAAEKLDPYAGAQLSFASLGAVKQTAESNTGGTSPFSSTVNNSIAGGSSVGFDLLGGFNYFFTDNFALGAEFSWGYHSVKMGGDYTTESSFTSGGVTTTASGAGNATRSQSGFRVGSTAGVNASIFF